MLSHDKLLACLIYLGYPVNIKGMCYGVALMGAQAILANDMKSFRERLNYLKQIDEKKLAANIEEAEKIRLSIIQGLRSDLGDSSDNQTFNAYVVSMEKGLKPNVRIALSIKKFF